MAVLDWIFLAMLLASMLVGAWRGLVFEVLSALGWLAAFVVAQWAGADMAAWLPLGQVEQPAVRYAAGFLAVFVLVVFACSLVAWLAKRLIQASGLRPADRTLGALFGMVRAGVLLLVMALVVQTTSLRDAQWWQDSGAAPWLLVALQEIRPSLPQGWEKYLPS